MNRRNLLASLLAVPVVAALPDVRRPRYFDGGTVLRDLLADIEAKASHLRGLEAWKIGQVARLAQNALDGSLAVMEAVKAGADPLAAGWPFVLREAQIAAEAPPYVRTVPRDEMRAIVREVRATPLRVALRGRG